MLFDRMTSEGAKVGIESLCCIDREMEYRCDEAVDNLGRLSESLLWSCDFLHGKILLFDSAPSNLGEVIPRLDLVLILDIWRLNGNGRDFFAARSCSISIVGAVVIIAGAGGAAGGIDVAGSGGIGGLSSFSAISLARVANCGSEKCLHLNMLNRLVAAFDSCIGVESNGGESGC